jgi:spore maturation protein B
MSIYIIPFFIIFTLIYACIKKVNAYDSFVFGAKTSFDLVLTSVPYLVAIFIVLEVFRGSGLSTLLSNILAPIFNIFGIPSELNELILIKPFSGCGALAVLENIFISYGPDSYLARAGCCIAGASEAIFYVTAVYFSKTNIKKFSYGIPVAIIANFIGVIVACNICKIM